MMFWERRSTRVNLLAMVLFGALVMPLMFDGVGPEINSNLFPAWVEERLLLTYLWICIVSLFLVRLFDRKPLSWIGLGGHPWTARELLLGLIGGALFAFIAASPHLLASGSVDLRPDLSLLLPTIVAVLLFAAGEELLFRGYLFQRVVELVGPTGGIIAFALLFTMAHAANSGFDALPSLNLFLGGILFGLLWLKSGSLWMVIGFHAGWNLCLGPLFGLPVSGNLFGGISLLDVGGGELPPWLSGGAYGPEGSLVATISILLAILLVVRSRLIHLAPWAFSARYQAAVRR